MLHMKSFMFFSFRMCVGAWHAACYRQHEKDRFPVLSALDLDEAVIDDEAMEEEVHSTSPLARPGLWETVGVGSSCSCRP